MSPEAADGTVEADLLAAIAEEPDAIEPRLTYADFLQDRDDPRGELIVVQAQRLARPDDVALELREKELVTELTNRLILRTAPDPLPSDMIVRWHLGFVDAVLLTARTIRKLRTTHRSWFGQPDFAVVREIDITSKFARSLRVVRRLALERSLRTLHFGDAQESLEEPAIEAIVSRIPQLTTLHLRASQVPPLGPLRSLKLRALVLAIYRLDDAGLAAIMQVPWQLETFGLDALYPVNDDIYPVLAQLYNGSTLPTVKHFEIAGHINAINVIDTIASSKRAATVESITADFQRTTYDDQLRIERHRAALAHVRFEPLLGQSTYKDVENMVSTGSFLNYRLDRAADALPLYERALRSNPTHTSARHNRGVALRKLGRLEESLVAFDLLIGESKRPTASMYNGRHYTLCDLGRRADAVLDLERAIAIDPNFTDAWNNLGVERQYAGDAQGALEAYRRCQQLAPEHTYAPRNEADVLLELGLPGEALPIYTRLLAAKPGNATLTWLIAHSQLEMGHAAEARATLDGLLADPAQRGPRPLVVRALALRDVGEHQAAAADLEATATTTDCPGWYATTLYVRSLDDLALWTRIVPAEAITPRQITDAVLAYATHARARGATAMHEATVDDQLDCTELSIAAALRGHQRDLAVQRARAAATLFAEQGPQFLRRWWQTLSTIAVVTNRELDDDARRMLSLVIRALRGRARIADVIALE